MTNRRCFVALSRQNPVSDLAVETLPSFAVGSSQLDKCLGVECIGWKDSCLFKFGNDSVSFRFQRLQELHRPFTEFLLAGLLPVDKKHGHNRIDEDHIAGGVSQILAGLC